MEPIEKLSEGTFVGYYGKENKWKVYRVSDGDSRGLHQQARC